MSLAGIPVTLPKPTHTIIMDTLAEGIYQIRHARVHSGEKTPPPPINFVN